MAQIAFFSVAAHGHVSPTFGVVEELVARGHRVTYFTTGAFAERLAGLGASVCRYDIAAPASQSRRAFTDNDPGALPLFFLHGSEERIALAEREFADGAPDLVVYDNTVPFAGRALARRWGCRAAQFFPSLASSRGWALMDEMVARTGRAPHHEANGAEFDRRLAGFLDAAGLGGLSTEEFMDFEEELNLAFLPREFQPEQRTFGAHYHFVGPSLGGRADEGEWRRPEDGRPVVLVSLGTVFNQATDFYRGCLEAFAGSEFHTVMSVGAETDPAVLGSPPHHVEVHTRVPQLSVLEQADVFVTHGGMGSTMEALAFAAPMVTVPQMVEQEIIADRVAQLGLGRRLAPAASGAELLDAVRAVHAAPETAARATAMRERVREAGGARAAADALEAHLGGGEAATI
ncbi:oleandomycin glycosyltransferase [Streptomyces sp. AJS327]|uniref:macrolide family glycosyltransferase n=1 Tax=Streptomyces sp. AJS327 TaxID=2545265 RepID=UPI0015DFD24F|nr:macrolide family glycosyltransferase [Streptomyces sp. AJS327]MBA0052616.1 oleandomycin glycosyltransferase [Streptomyces sp. AJS327]